MQDVGFSGPDRAFWLSTENRQHYKGLHQPTLKKVPDAPFWQRQFSKYLSSMCDSKTEQRQICQSATKFLFLLPGQQHVCAETKSMLQRDQKSLCKAIMPYTNGQLSQRGAETIASGPSFQNLLCHVYFPSFVPFMCYCLLFAMPSFQDNSSWMLAACVVPIELILLKP